MNDVKNKMARTETGKVISDKMNKSVVVLVETQVPHPVYGKFITRSSKMHAHDENNECRIGDVVQIVECRPLSRTKSWRLAKVLDSAQ